MLRKKRRKDSVFKVLNAMEKKIWNEPKTDRVNMTVQELQTYIYRIKQIMLEE